MDKQTNGNLARNGLSQCCSSILLEHLKWCRNGAENSFLSFHNSYPESLLVYTNALD